MEKVILAENLVTKSGEVQCIDYFVFNIGKNIVQLNINRSPNGSIFQERIANKYYEIHDFIENKLHLFSNNARYEELTKQLYKHL